MAWQLREGEEGEGEGVQPWERHHSWLLLQILRGTTGTCRSGIGQHQSTTAFEPDASAYLE